LGTRYSKLRPIVKNSDVVNINFLLTPATEGFFDRELLFSVKNGAYLVNTARGRKWIPKP